MAKEHFYGFWADMFGSNFVMGLPCIFDFYLQYPDYWGRAAATPFGVIMIFIPYLWETKYDRIR